MKDNRKFGRSSEVLYNEKLFKIVKQLETLSLNRLNNIPPKAKEEKALWIDPDDSNDLKYYKGGQWYPFYKEKLQMITEILSEYTPTDPVPGQLWINDGVLMYFDGMEWLVVKGGDLENKNFNAASYHDFLIIDPLLYQGDIVTDTSSKSPIKKSQFLIPNVETDKFFIDGYNNEDYETLTNVAIQYDTDRLQDRIAAAVHVNPSNLLDIKKSLIIVNKDDNFDGLIRVNKRNKEFYGFTHGGGRLLLKDIDYTNARGNFIKLTKKARRKFDFIMVIEYVFGNSKHKGKVSKKKIDFNRGSSASINTEVDYNDKTILIFEDGYVKDISKDNYEIKDDELIFKGNLKGKKVQVLALDMDNIFHKGKVKNGEVVFYKEDDFENLIDIPFVFLMIGDTYKLIRLDKDKLKDGKIPLPEQYSIDDIEYMTVSFSSNILDQGLVYIKADYVEEDENTFIEEKGTIDLTNTSITPRSNIVLFINNKIISKKDYTFNPIKGVISELPNHLIGHKAYIFVDKGSRLILDEKIEEVLVPTESSNKSLVYIEEKLVCDPSTVLSYNYPVEGYENEVKKIITIDGKSKWYVRKGSQWIELKDREKGVIKLLEEGEDKDLSEYIQLTKPLEDYKKDELINIVHNKTFSYLTGKKDDVKIVKTKILNNKVCCVIETPKDYHIEKADNILLIQKQKVDQYVFTFYFKNVDIVIPEFYQSKLVNVIYDKYSSKETIESAKLMLEMEIKELLKKSNRTNPKLINKDGKYIGQDAIIEIDVENKVALVETVIAQIGIKNIVGTIKHLEHTTNTYLENKNNLSILQTFGGEQAQVYSYKFASHIEQPRKVKEINNLNLLDNEKNDGLGHKISYKNFYNTGANELSVYLDGVKQYYINETSEKTFKIEGDLEVENFDYIGKPLVKAAIISEPCESNQDYSSIRRIINTKDSLPGMYNTYEVDIDLYPGYNRIFIDGIRQSSDMFKIIDKRHIMINSITEDMIKDNSQILIEHKNDVTIKEKTITLSNFDDLKRRNNKIHGVIDVNKYDIDKSILETREDMLIYVDGVYIGNSYTTDIQSQSIIITASDVSSIEDDFIFNLYLLKHNKIKDLLLKEKNPSKKQEYIKKIKEIEELLKKQNQKYRETKILFEWR